MHGRIERDEIMTNFSFLLCENSLFPLSNTFLGPESLQYIPEAGGVGNGCQGIGIDVGDLGYWRFCDDTARIIS